MEAFDEDEMLDVSIFLCILCSCVDYYLTYCCREPFLPPLMSRYAYIMSVLDGSERICFENFRMRKSVFLELCNLLADKYGLSDLGHVTVIEQVGTFLLLVGLKIGTRQVKLQMYRSSATVHRCFRRVLRACIRMSWDWVRPKHSSQHTHPYIATNTMYMPFFKDCIGAIDGTHVHARVPEEKKHVFTNRRGVITQNVLVAVDFDCTFIYFAAGWEGSAHDTKVLAAAVTNQRSDFPHPSPGKYYLVDSAYANTRGYLAPFKGDRYHLGQFRNGSPKTPREKYNRVHSSLRCAVERSIGIWKNRFEILSKIPVGYSWGVQTGLIGGTMAIHNFIRCTDAENDIQFEPTLGHGDDLNSSECRPPNCSSMNDGGYMNRLRLSLMEEISN